MIKELFENFVVVPKSQDDVPECAVRILFLVLLGSLLFKLPILFYVVVSVLIVGIILYKKCLCGRVNVENFDYLYNQAPMPPPLKRAPVDAQGNLIVGSSWNPFNASHPLAANERLDVPTNNAKLFGTAMERTLIPPIITPRSHDMDFWRATNFTTHSHINTATPDELYQSGYIPNAPCSYGRCVINPPQINGRLVQPTTEGFCTGGACNDRSPYTFNATTAEPTSTSVTQMLNVGLVNDGCGYDPANSQFNMPVNLMVGECNKNPEMRRFNQNLFTSYIGPDSTTFTSVNEPINANIGTAFQQQFEPVDVRRGANGTLAFIQENPLDPENIQNSVNEVNNPPCKALSAANITDPRLTSYGTSYRAYTDPLLGQTQYYYDDIDAVMMPSYLTHNKLDIFDFGESSGPMQWENGISLASVRGKAEANALDLEIQRRTELEERLMRKINAESWQQKMFPISHNNYSSRGI